MRDFIEGLRLAIIAIAEDIKRIKTEKSDNLLFMSNLTVEDGIVDKKDTTYPVGTGIALNFGASGTNSVWKGKTIKDYISRPSGTYDGTAGFSKVQRTQPWVSLTLDAGSTLIIPFQSSPFDTLDIVSGSASSGLAVTTKARGVYALYFSAHISDYRRFLEFRVELLVGGIVKGEFKINYANSGHFLRSPITINVPMIDIRAGMPITVRLRENRGSSSGRQMKINYPALTVTKLS